MKIEIFFNDKIENILAYGIRQSKEFTGIFEGDTKKGNFNFKTNVGQFKGIYLVKDKLLEITFEKKPFYLPATAIKQFLKQHIK